MTKHNKPFDECLKCPIGKRHCNKNTKWISCEIKAHYFVREIIQLKSYINLIDNQFYGRDKKFKRDFAK
jgi:hypothetical protein